MILEYVSAVVAGVVVVRTTCGVTKTFDANDTYIFAWRPGEIGRRAYVPADLRPGDSTCSVDLFGREFEHLNNPMSQAYYDRYW